MIDQKEEPPEKTERPKKKSDYDIRRHYYLNYNKYEQKSIYSVTFVHEENIQVRYFFDSSSSFLKFHSHTQHHSVYSYSLVGQFCIINRGEGGGRWCIIIYIFIFFYIGGSVCPQLINHLEKKKKRFF